MEAPISCHDPKSVTKKKKLKVMAYSTEEKETILQNIFTEIQNGRAVRVSYVMPIVFRLD